jgi:hypothetical protein
MTADPAQNGSVLGKVSAVFAAFDSGDAIRRHAVDGIRPSGVGLLRRGVPRRSQALDPADRDRVVISQAAASAFWPGQSPVGRTIRLDPSRRIVTVAGVAANIIHRTKDEPSQPYIYRPPVESDYASASRSDPLEILRSE